MALHLRLSAGAALVALAAVVLLEFITATPQAEGGHYRLVEDWPQAPPGHTFGTISGVTVH